MEGVCTEFSSPRQRASSCDMDARESITDTTACALAPAPSPALNLAPAHAGRHPHELCNTCCTPPPTSTHIYPVPPSACSGLWLSTIARPCLHAAAVDDAVTAMMRAREATARSQEARTRCAHSLVPRPCDSASASLCRAPMSVAAAAAAARNASSSVQGSSSGQAPCRHLSRTRAAP